VLTYAGYWTVRIAVADWMFRLGTPPSIRRAIRLAPGNADYLGGLAQVEPAGAVGDLRMAAALSPADAGLRIELGLACEEHGDFPQAEASLLQAVRLDRTFAPRRMLAEFYFRRREAEKFWPAAKAALEISGGDVSDLFRDCWALGPDAGRILERAIPDRPVVLAEYLNFLLEEDRLTAAAPVAGRVLEKADAASVASLLNYCDRSLESGHEEEAWAVWKGLGDRRLIPYRAASPEAPDLVTNGDFRKPITGSGFDWRFLGPAGIYLEREGAQAALAIGFTGKQAEDAEILSQYVPLLPLRKYGLSVQYRVKDIGAEAGVRCFLIPVDGSDLLRDTGLLPGGVEGDTEREFHFVTPRNTKLARLVLGYRRMPGAMRIEGTMILRRFSLALAREEIR